MSYLDAYIARINALGANHKERELNASIHDFNKYLAEHPSVENVILKGSTVAMSIISNKQNESKFIKQFLSALSVNIQPGDTLLWKNKTWLIFKQELNPNEAYHSSYGVQCNNNLKWIDDYGVLNQVSCYIKGSMESVIKNNFRTWNNLITPQPNQYLEAIIPVRNISINQKFIIDNRAWFVTDYDTTSVDGVMYLSFSEGKVDTADDDVENAVANKDKENLYRIEFPVEFLNCKTLENYSFTPLVYKGQELVEDKLECTFIENPIRATFTQTGNTFVFTGLIEGEAILRFALLGNDNVYSTITMRCSRSPDYEVTYEIVGNDAIKVGQYCDYRINRIEANVEPTTLYGYTASNDLADCEVVDRYTLRITANSNNQIGEITIEFLTNDGATPKTINIVSLW